MYQVVPNAFICLRDRSLACYAGALVRARVAVFLTSERNDYLRMVKADALAAGERLGLAVDVAFADNEAITQIQQVYAALRAPEGTRPRAVLAMPVTDESLGRVARSAVGAGIGWVSLFRRLAYVDELRRSHPQVPVFVSSPDHSATGRIQGRQIRALLRDRGQVLFVKGMASSSSTLERFAATEQELRGSAIEIVSQIDGNWSEEVAAREVERWLRLMAAFKEKRVDLVACQSDAMARGVVRVLRATADALGRHELASVPVLGTDGLSDVGLRMVDAGDLAATIVLPDPVAPALQALEGALFRGLPPPPEIVLPPRAYPEEAVLAARVSARTS
jgi:ABC-type sugar transport system substrate-binding protein